MRFIRIIMILGIGCSLFTACGGKKVVSQWKHVPITIDGKGNDWTNVPLLYYDEFKFVMGIVHTDSTLDLMIRFNDPRLAAMIQMRGATLWVDQTRKKAKVYGIQFINPSGFEAGMMRPAGDRESRNPSETSEEEKRQRLSRGRFMLIKNDVPLEISGALKDTVSAAADYHDGLFCFEYEILFKRKLPVGDEIYIGFELAGLDKEKRNEMRRKMDLSMNSDAREGRMGGGRMQQDRSGDERSDLDFSSGKKLWLAVTLASE